jgi:hypothetical protein
VKRILPLLALGLAGCKTVEPQVEIREVPVPVPVACVDPSAIPPEPPTVSQRFNGDARHDLQILAPSAQALRRWGQELRALLEGCTGEPASEPKAEAEEAS